MNNDYWFNPDAGAGRRAPREAIPEEYRGNVPPEEPYIAGQDLQRAVNLAIYLGRPLLLEGEPGCGKSRLARAIAWNLQVPFFPWYVTSGTRARDGLYFFDSLRRLNDVQLQENRQKDPNEPKNYREWRALGSAFKVAESGVRSVVLIDEVDKADTDFCNDLLTVLDDQQEFTVPETNERIVAPAASKPIIIITSNREKGDLPEPFLRRCLYFCLSFPTRDELLQIVAAHARDPRRRDEPQVQEAVDKFLSIRQDSELKRKPGTSEFRDWLKACENFKDRPTQRVSFPETLFKHREDWERYSGSTDSTR